ncbi:MAG: DHH family phosphoesterase [Methanothrix sp.]
MEEFIVSSVKDTSNRMQLCTLIGKTQFQLYSAAIAEPLDIVALHDSKSAMQLEAKDITGKKASMHEFESSLSVLISRINMHPLQKIEIKPLDEALSAMEEKLTSIAQRIILNFISGAPIIIRFHNDGDGASGAVAIYKALEKLSKETRIGTSNCIWVMNKGVAYTMQSLSYDKLRLSSYHSVIKPLLVMTDFGTLEESETAVKNAQDTMDIAWIDHHPVYDSFKAGDVYSYINPWLDGFGSDVTAGAMACAVAGKISGVRVKNLTKASLLSDHSAYAEYESEPSELAVIMDAITTDASARSNNVTPKSIIATIEDESSYKLIFTQAKAQMDEAVSKGMKHMKPRKVGNVTIATLDYSHISENYYGYVRHGRFTSVFSDSVTAKFGPSITIVYNKSLISIRVSKELSGKLRLLSLIAKMKEDTDYISNGGGHNEAASVKLEDEYALHDFLALLYREIESRLGN